MLSYAEACGASSTELGAVPSLYRDPANGALVRLLSAGLVGYIGGRACGHEAQQRPPVSRPAAVRK
jgi:hypothetical protein